MDPNLAAFSAINPKLRDLDNVSVTTDISLDSNDTALSDTGGGRYFTFFSSCKSVSFSKIRNDAQLLNLVFPCFHSFYLQPPA